MPTIPRRRRIPAVRAFRQGGGVGSDRDPGPVSRRARSRLLGRGPRRRARRRVRAAGPIAARVASGDPARRGRARRSLRQRGGVALRRCRRGRRRPGRADPAARTSSRSWCGPPTGRRPRRRPGACCPTRCSFEDAAFNVGRTALLVAALAAGDVGALRTATEDRLHQDRRLARAHDTRHAIEAALAAGAYAAWLSGSGPSAAALVEPDVRGRDRGGDPRSRPDPRPRDRRGRRDGRRPERGGASRESRRVRRQR